MRKRIGITSIALACLLGGAACTERRAAIQDADTEQMVRLLMPQRIEIVEAFTGFKSFDDDEIPDGIELLILPKDSFGDAVKIAGTIRAELYTYRQASGNREGERVCDPWEIELLTDKDQKRYWNMVTGMYEVELEFPAGVTPAGEKYVLVVTYHTPLAEHMTDECVLEMPANLG